MMNGWVSERELNAAAFAGAPAARMADVLSRCALPIRDV